MTWNGAARPPLSTEDRADTEDAAATAAKQASRCVVSDGSPVGDKSGARAVLAAVAEHVSSHHECGEPADRLSAGLALLAPLVRAGHLDAVGAVFTAVLAAEAAGIGRREAEEAARCAGLTRSLGRAE